MTCRICGNEELDALWEELAGENPGPNVMAIGHWRHASTGFELLGRWMADDDGVPRCVTCLRVVPEARALQGGRTTIRLATGHEPLCCGQPREEAPEVTHAFTRTATGYTGMNSGRMRYRVVCHSCLVLVHEATTGPDSVQRSHTRGERGYERPLTPEDPEWPENSGEENQPKRGE